MFHTLLIANRGEIACRVAATARRLGIKTVAVYSDADAHAAHVAACDVAIHIGGNAPAESYLRWERIIEAAKSTGAQAIHPGYGFLSENTDFAQACQDAGLVFVGPPPAAIQAMGLKAESKRLMEQAGVPLVPGYHGEDQRPEVLAAEAQRIGFPVLIKASAGGGGKGMRRVERAEDFADALASCQREARNSFGNDHVLIERYAQRPRHIEVQVFADQHGHIIHLNERDCSVQRRHQKVLEESPAPGMTPELRQAMGQVAVAAARAVGYVGAGTVEFIVEQPLGYQHPEAMKFYFMEMNTRLQVEHPVTEAITGLDLVEWQLRVAAGEPLPLSQADIPLVGHAIEARLCAETPTPPFLPATGPLHVYQTPAHAAFTATRLGLRVDDGVREGDTITPHYDAMVAKLIVHGATRAEALARLDQALHATRVAGPDTNLPLLRRLVRSPAFVQAELDTALIDREHDFLFAPHTPPLAQAAAAWVLHQWLAPQQAKGFQDPLGRADGWHSHGPNLRHFEAEVSAPHCTGPSAAPQRLRAQLQAPRHGADRSQGGLLSVWLCPEGAATEQPLLTQVPVALAGPAAGTQALRVMLGGQQFTAHVNSKPKMASSIAHIDGVAIVFKSIDLTTRAASTEATGGQLTAPMPGKVVSYAVQAGQTVKKGMAVAVMEAMKMEHTLHAPHDGQVTELLYAPGDQVAEGQALLSLKALES